MNLSIEFSENKSTSLALFENSLFEISTAISEATSPAFIPPIPSATMRTVPNLPKSYFIDLSNDQSSLVRFEHTKKLSSLWSLTLPTCVFADN